MDRWIAHQKKAPQGRQVGSKSGSDNWITYLHMFLQQQPIFIPPCFSATDSDSLTFSTRIILWFGFLFTLLLPFFWANSGYILQHCIKHRLKLLFCGPTGTGKILGHRGRTQRGKMWEVGPWIPTFWNRWQMSTIVRNYMTFYKNTFGRGVC